MTRAEVVQVAAIWLAVAVFVALTVTIVLLAWSIMQAVALVGGFFAALIAGGIT